MPTYTTSVYGPERPLGVPSAPTAAGSTWARPTATVSRGSSTPAAPRLAVMRPPLSTGADHVPVYLAHGSADRRGLRLGPAHRLDLHLRRRRHLPAGVHGARQPSRAGSHWPSRSTPLATLYVTDVSTNPADRAGVRPRGQPHPDDRRDGQVCRSPTASPLDEAGNVYVTDSNNGRLLVFDTAGTGRRPDRARRGRGQPRPAAWDRRQRRRPGLRRRRHRPGRVRLLHLQGRREHASSTSGSSAARASATATFEFPNGLALDARGRIYVVDSGNDRVQVWSY